jgi:hypothetical protein
MKQQTQKKVKVVGTQQYLNTSTGELEDFQVMSIEERDFNFHKIWMRNFITSLDLVGNQKTRLAFWIIEHLNKENMLTMTYRQISDASGISLDTVRVTMKILVDADFLRRLNQGCYIVNPDVLFKGTRKNRLNILQQYNDANRPNAEKQTDEQRLKNLLNTIDSLTRQAMNLKEKIDAKRSEESEEQTA